MGKSRKYHDYTAEQIVFFRNAVLPKQGDKEGVEKFAQKFVSFFSKRPGWTPISKPISLLLYAKKVQDNWRKFTPKVDEFIFEYSDKVITSRALKQIVDQLNRENDAIFTSDEVLNRLEYLIDYTGGGKKPVVEEVEPIVKGPPVNVEEEKTPSTLLFYLPRSFEVLVNGKCVWKGNHRPDVKKAVIVDSAIAEIYPVSSGLQEIQIVENL